MPTNRCAPNVTSCASEQANLGARTRVPIGATEARSASIMEGASSNSSTQENFTGQSKHLLTRGWNKILRSRSFSPNGKRKQLSKPRIHITLFQLICTFILVSQGARADEASSASSAPGTADSSPQATTTATCFGGLQTFEKISMSTFENPTGSESSGSFGSGILVQQDDQALTSECVNLCRSQSNCLSFVIDYNKFECKSYATTQQELQQEFDAKFQTARSMNGSSGNGTESIHASASTVHFQHLLPSASSNYFEKICLDGVANRNQFSDVCGQNRLWVVERVIDSFLDGYIEKEVTNVNNKDECSKLCIFETQFVCRSADYDQHSRLCRLSKEDRRTQPQAMRYMPGSNRQYLENQCATPGPSSCVYESKKNVGIISMDALKFAQTTQDCQMRCNQETTFNCRSYSFYQQRCFLSGDDSVSLNSNMIKLPTKQGWQFGEKKCLVELCTKGIFSYEKITGFTLRSALSTPIDLMMPGSSSMTVSMVGNNLDDLEKLQHESSQTRLRALLPLYNPRSANSTSNMVNAMMMIAANNNPLGIMDPMHESASTLRQHRSTNNLAITNHCRHSCDLGYLNCPAFTIDYKNNRCQRLDRNSQGRHNELVARDGFAYYEKICLRVPEIMSMCQDKYWIFERVIGYELAPRLYDRTLKFVQSRRDCEEYCLEEKQFQCRSALYNDETSDCKLSRYDRRLASLEGGYHRNFNARISYLENQCVRDHGPEKTQCYYEQAKDEPAYPTYTEHIEMVPPPPSTPSSPSPTSSIEKESSPYQASTMNVSRRYGSSYCEQLCNDNAKFECHSFGYYASTAQCFLSGDDSLSAGELATTPSTGFTYFEKKCRLDPNATNSTRPNDDSPSTGTGPTGATTPTMNPANLNPYFQPPINQNQGHSGGLPGELVTTDSPSFTRKPPADSTNSFSGLSTQKPYTNMANETTYDADMYKCGNDHTFVYQRVSGFEPIGGYLTLLIRNNEHPGIVAECSELCRRAYECRAFIVDYTNNQCFAMLENSSVGLLNLRQTLGKDYFEGFCIANHLLLRGNACKSKTWVMDKIVDQAVIGVQHQKLIPDADRVQCRQACLEERLFYCKSAMFDASTGDCKLYSIDRESIPQMRLHFTKGVDFFENQCQINSSMCPYDAIERDMTIITTTKSIQARSTFECEHACNEELGFNCRSYTYIDQYPSLPNMCILSSDSRSTSLKGSVKELHHTLYAERNCYLRRPRYPGGSNQKPDGMYSAEPAAPQGDPYKPPPPHPQLHSAQPMQDNQNPPKIMDDVIPIDQSLGLGPAPGQGCDPHQYTFERTFGYDYRFGQKERASISPSIGIAIACQQECLRRGDRCQSFVVEYSLPSQNCFLIDSRVGSNKKLLVKSLNSAYFEKVCLPRTGVDSGSVNAPLLNEEPQSMDIAPSYSNTPWSPQVPNQLPYYLQQQQLVQNYPSRTCPKLWSFERFVNHNFTVQSDLQIDNIITRGQCETLCLNEASFGCRSVTYDYANKICRLFKNTRRTMMSQFIDLESPAALPTSSFMPIGSSSAESTPGTALILNGPAEILQMAHSSNSPVTSTDTSRRQAGSRQLTSVATAEPSSMSNNIDYMENTCAPEPSSCQYRQLYDQFSPYIDKMTHAVSLSDCQRQCDLEKLFSCKSINYDPGSKNCMLINEDLISLNRGQQSALLPKKNTIYSEKGNCEMVSVQCNPQEMLVSINFDSPFRGRIIAKGNPEQCYLIGDGQTSIQFPIVFGPKCGSRQEGHNTFVNEVLIQQHPVIMTDSDKTVRVMCAFEAPEQTITLKNPSSRDNKTGIDVGAPDASRTRNDRQQFNSVVSNKASPPSVLLRILDLNSRDASMINLGDDLVLKIQMQMDGGSSALGIFARNLAARSSNGESLLLIDNEGCPVDPQVFPALTIDPKDGKSLYSTFKAFRFPSSGLVNFEVQIKFCPERCQPVDCLKGQRMKSYGRRKRDTQNGSSSTLRTSVLQSVNPSEDLRNPLENLSTVMKPGKAFQYVRELLLAQKSGENTASDVGSSASQESGQDAGQMPVMNTPGEHTSVSSSEGVDSSIESDQDFENQARKTQVEQTSQGGSQHQQTEGNPDLNSNRQETFEQSREIINSPASDEIEQKTAYQKSIVLHVDEKVVPSEGNYMNHRALNYPLTSAPYGRFPLPSVDLGSGKQETQFMQRPMMTSDSTEAVQSHTMRVESSSTHETSPVIDQMSSSESPPVATIAPEPVTNSATYTGGNSLSEPETQTQPSTSQMSPKDVPLRFSILVGENQAPTSEWRPGGPGPVLVMNSTNVDLDHIVIPGKGEQYDNNESWGGSNQSPKTQIPSASNSDSNDQALYSDEKSTHRSQSPSNTKANKQSEQTFDALPSNSVAAEVKVNLGSNQFDATGSHRPTGGASESAASHDCQCESSNNNRLRTIMWAGSFVIALNVTLVVLSLILYFKRIHLRKHHNIVRATSECDSHNPASRRGWPSVLLKSKNNLGTSLNTHEHFFCKLNSKPSGSNALNGHEFSWPNLSSSSSHSTISSMASPSPATGVRMNQPRSSIKSIGFDVQSSLTRSNFNLGQHKTVLDINSPYSNNSERNNLHASYTNNIDETHPDSFQT